MLVFLFAFITLSYGSQISDSINLYNIQRPLSYKYVNAFMGVLRTQDFVQKLKHKILNAKQANSSDKILPTEFHKTLQGTEITYIQMGYQCDADDKLFALVVGGIQGSDWITVSAALDLAKELAVKGPDNLHILLRYFCFLIVPVLNIDGFTASRSYNEMKNWKKNFEKPSEDHIKYFPNDKDCLGVNLLYNQEFQMQDKKNIQFCDDFYGHYPNSQKESQFLTDLLSKKGRKYFVFILRQGGLHISYPTRSSYKKSTNWKGLDLMAKQLAEEAQKVNNRKYDYGHGLEFEKDVSGGTTSDWIYAHFKTKFVFDFFLSDSVNNEVVSASDFQMSCKEFVASVTNVIKNYLDRYTHM